VAGNVGSRNGQLESGWEYRMQGKVSWIGTGNEGDREKAVGKWLGI
jgi:hypothetical protein